MSASWIKSITEANLTSLHGPVYSFGINKFKELEDGYEIEGIFRQSFGDAYSFTMKIDSKGNVKSYERKPKIDESNRKIRLSNV